MRVILPVILFFTLSASAADGFYPVATIPASLLKNANAVLRLDETRFEIVNTGKTITRTHHVITILNENGDQWAEFAEWYDKFREVESFEGILYDAGGRQLRKVRRKDLQDMSAVSDMSLMEDTRVKKYNFYYKVYPHTVEYTVEISNKGTLFFPSWNPRPGENISVERSSIAIASHPGYEFRYKPFRYKENPVVTQEKNFRVSSWAVTALPALARESYSPPWHELSPVVVFGPSAFEMDNYKGNMATWQDFGKFVHSLRQGKDVLPAEVKARVQEISASFDDPAAKVAALYRFMQSHTRYVSIQLGIGGWQPFDATFVANKKYGDCKALTNYMYALLKEAGIASYYTLIRAGRTANYITEDFPSQQFNHVILCVPMATDTIWLECTSQTLPAGYLGDMTADRPALLIDEQGGRMVRTPKYGINDNVQSRRITAVLAVNGTLTLSALTSYTGLQQDDIHGFINQLSKDKVKEFLQQKLEFATYNINSFDYVEKKQRVPAINESLGMTVSNYATITGKRLFIIPNVMTRVSGRPARDSTRQYDFQLGMEYRDTDTVTIDIPEGYEVEKQPQDVALTSIFGRYSSSIIFDGNKLYYYRNLEYKGGRHPAALYNEYVAFLETAYNSDRNRIVLVKK